MDWLKANKTAIGGLLVVASGPVLLQATDNPSLLIWGLLMKDIGVFLAGGGLLKSDAQQKKDQ